MNLISYLCNIFACIEHELFETLKNPKFRGHAERVLAKKQLVTNYRDKQQVIRCDEFSRGDAWRTMAFNGFLKVRIQQYFYAKYEIELNFPRLPLVVQRGPKLHRAYYPMELLSVVNGVEDPSTEVYHLALVKKNTFKARPSVPKVYRNRRMCASSCDEEEDERENSWS